MITLVSTTFSDALFISLFSIFIVFAILTFITLSIESLKYIHHQPKKTNTQTLFTPPKKSFNISDVKDEDMMVALLVASIEHFEQTKKDINIVSIKEIRSA